MKFFTKCNLQDGKKIKMKKYEGLKWRDSKMMQKV